MNTFNKENHEYRIDGERATGVTTIIGVLAKPALIGWAAKMAIEYIKETAELLEHELAGEKVWKVSESLLEESKAAHNRKKDAAAEHGTDAHELVETYIKGIIEKCDGNPNNAVYQYEETSGPIRPFIDWAIENVDHFLYSERVMFNKEMFIAGTADFGCIMKDGKRLIGDFKTSSGVYGIDYFIQCAGYKILAEAEGDAPYDGCVIVRLGKKGPSDFDVTYRYRPDVDEDAFHACLTLYRAQATFKKPAYGK